MPGRGSVHDPASSGWATEPVGWSRPGSAPIWWAKISTGDEHTCAVRADRSLWCWGANSSGQLGLGDTIDRLVPTRV